MNGVELVTSWLTPTVLFCVLNLMIGIIFVISGLKPRNKPPKAGDNDAVSPPQLARVPSLFERVNSIKLSFYRSENPDPVPVSTVANQDDQAHQKPEGNDFHVTRSKSDTGAKASAPAAAMKKYASEKVPVAEEEEERKLPETMAEKREELGRGDEAVDARADDFINRFRQQLKMQRLDSLLRYKEMLKRGGS